MTNVIPFLQSKSDCISEVLDVDSFGRVLRISTGPNSEGVQVVAQAQHVGQAIIGDMVLFLNTNIGVVVTAILAKPQDAPAATVRNSQGNIRIYAEESICISTDTASVKINGDGQIWIDGSQVELQSDKDMNIAGWPIRLN